MGREPYAKLHASQAIEDLLADSRHDNNQQNWLLSYVDVFILIIMLVITLLAMTDLTTSSQQKQTNKKISKKQIKSFKKTSVTKPVATKNSESKPISHSNKKPEIKELPAVKPKSASPPEIAKKTVVAGQKNFEKNRIKQQTAKTTLPKSALHVSKKPENKVSSDHNTKSPSLFAIAKKIVAAEQQSSEIKPDHEKKENRVLNEPNSKEANLQTEKKPIQKQQNPEKNWQDRLKNKLDDFELNKFINVKIKEGYAQIEIQDNVLFDSAKAELTEEGKLLIEKLTSLLKQSSGIIFIEGHTDNQPIATEKFPSNWELGSARATSVLHFLTSQGLNSQRLRAVTYADTMPMANNNSEEGRRKNRRVN